MSEYDVSQALKIINEPTQPLVRSSSEWAGRAGDARRYLNAVRACQAQTSALLPASNINP